MDRRYKLSAMRSAHRSREKVHVHSPFFLLSFVLDPHTYTGLLCSRGRIILRKISRLIYDSLLGVYKRESISSRARSTSLEMRKNLRETCNFYRARANRRGGEKNSVYNVNEVYALCARTRTLLNFKHSPLHVYNIHKKKKITSSFQKFLTRKILLSPPASHPSHAQDVAAVTTMHFFLSPSGPLEKFVRYTYIHTRARFPRRLFFSFSRNTYTHIHVHRDREKNTRRARAREGEKR